MGLSSSGSSSWARFLPLDDATVGADVGAAGGSVAGAASSDGKVGADSPLPLVVARSSEGGRETGSIPVRHCGTLEKEERRVSSSLRGGKSETTIRPSAVISHFCPGGMVPPPSSSRTGAVGCQVTVIDLDFGTGSAFLYVDVLIVKGIEGSDVFSTGRELLYRATRSVGTSESSPLM